MAMKTEFEARLHALIAQGLAAGLTYHDAIEVVTRSLGLLRFAKDRRVDFGTPPER